MDLIQNGINEETLFQPLAISIFLLFQRTYWRRIWIVQEVMLAQKILVLCGSKSLEWHCIRSLHKFLKGTKTTKTSVDNFDNSGIPNLRADSILKSDGLRIITEKLEQETLPTENRNSPLRYLVETYYDLESTDPRDKIYGILGLVRPEESTNNAKLKVDYSYSILEVYSEALQYLFPRPESVTNEAYNFIVRLRKSLSLSYSMDDITARFLCAEGSNMEAVATWFLNYEQLWLQTLMENKEMRPANIYWNPEEAMNPKDQSS
jgi:hypothetical protein